MNKKKEAAIIRYKKLESELGRTTSKTRAKTLIHELGKLEYMYGITTEEVHGKWKSGTPELDKAIELSRKHSLKK